LEEMNFLEVKGNHSDAIARLYKNFVDAERSSSDTLD
jgi:hypothetical protein